MSNKYRLIKIYPGSPKLGTELTPKVDKENSNTNNFYWEGSWFNPKDFPEFWELVVEKDYEILSYKDNVNNQLYIKDSQLKDCWCIKDGTAPFWKESDLKNSVIHSVKRLSDSEIFTIGDKINHSYQDKNNQTITKKYTIEKIYFITNDRLAFYVGDGLNLGIKSISKAKQPLFTTEDGVDIFENDKIYWINAFTLDDVYCDIYDADCGEFDLKNGLISIKEFNKLDKNNCELALFGFSTKEKAEEYILMNKPCLSINEITNLTETNSLDWLNKELIKLVKSKI